MIANESGTTFGKNLKRLDAIAAARHPHRQLGVLAGLQVVETVAPYTGIPGQRGGPVIVGLNHALQDFRSGQRWTGTALHRGEKEKCR